MKKLIVLSGKEEHHIGLQCSERKSDLFGEKR